MDRLEDVERGEYFFMVDLLLLDVLDVFVLAFDAEEVRLFLTEERWLG